MLSNCVYTYVLHHISHKKNPQGLTHSILSECCPQLIKSETLCTNRTLPLTLDSNIAPVEWYYSLFTEAELQSALEKHDSPFPTKVFLVFEAMEPITLGSANKRLVRFEVVDKESVDACINKVLRQA
jgi:hypothetical protein